MKFAFFSLIALVIVLCVYFFTPRDYLEDNERSDIQTAQESSTENTSDNTASGAQPPMPAEELLRQQKIDTFKKLEKARRNLDRSVSRLKALLWDVKLPKDEAEAMNKELLSAHSLLKNKKLLGAFTSLQEIQDELTQVEYSHNKAKEYIQQMRALTKQED